MNRHLVSPLTASQAVSPTKREYYDIFLAARGLAEVSMLAAKVPNYPELAQERAAWAAMVEERIADLMEAING